MTRTTLEDQLLAVGKPVPANAPCPHCARSCLPFEIVDVSDVSEIEHDMACSTCFLDAVRQRQAIDREATLGTWSGPEGDEVRARRNQILEQYAWTLNRGSPLTEACQDEFEELFTRLHRLTIDHPTPADVTWPVIPTLKYSTQGA